MKRWMKILGALILIGILAALYVWFFVYNKPHRDYEAAEPDHIMAADEMYFSYVQDKLLADSLYTGMVMQVYGPLSKVEDLDSIAVAIFVYGEGMFGDEGIRCISLPHHRETILGYNPGDMITIKGYCTGYNDTDVIMEKCSVIEKE